MRSRFRNTLHIIHSSDPDDLGVPIATSANEDLVDAKKAKHQELLVDCYVNWPCYHSSHIYRPVNAGYVTVRWQGCSLSPTPPHENHEGGYVTVPRK